MGTVEVRRVQPGDETLLKTTRLHALGDAPEAFGTTLAYAETRPDEVWSRQVEGWLGDNVCATWVAVDERGDGVGMITGLDEDERTHVIQVWVDGEHRGSGLIERLFDEVLAWSPHDRLDLAVAATNTRAKRVYERLGFVAFGEQDGPRGTELLLTRLARS